MILAPPSRDKTRRATPYPTILRRAAPAPPSDPGGPARSHIVPLSYQYRRVTARPDSPARHCVPGRPTKPAQSGHPSRGHPSEEQFGRKPLSRMGMHHCPQAPVDFSTERIREWIRHHVGDLLQLLALSGGRHVVFVLLSFSRRILARTATRQAAATRRLPKAQTGHDGYRAAPDRNR
jgi:hypothetical protein